MKRLRPERSGAETWFSFGCRSLPLDCEDIDGIYHYYLVAYAINEPEHRICGPGKVMDAGRLTVAARPKGKRGMEIGEKRAVWNVCCHSAVKRASRRLGQLYDDVLAPSGLRITQYTLLAQINHWPGISPKQLASSLVMDLSALGHTLKPLIRDGFVRTSPDPSDRRAKQLHLTKEGEAKREEASVLWRDAQRRVDDVFGKDDAAAMRRLMNRISSSEFEDSFLGSGSNDRSSHPTT